MMLKVFFTVLFSIPFATWSQTISEDGLNSDVISQFELTDFWYDNSLMDESKVDGVIYKKINGKFYIRKLSTFIDISWYGVSVEKPDITQVISEATFMASRLGLYVKLPNKHYPYELNKSSKIYSSIISDGAIVKVPGIYNRFLNLQENNITIANIHIVAGSKVYGKNAPIAIEINGLSNIKILNNKIVNARVCSSRKYGTKLSKDVSIERNVFIADFSQYARRVVQNDIVYIFDVDGLTIKDNTFDITNSNRIMKISSNDKTGKHPSSNILIANNIIRSTTISDKQVIDLFQHTRNVTIINNKFFCYGHNSVIENKTMGLSSYTTNLKVVNNEFTTDGTPLRVFGNFGSADGLESGFQDIYITGNTYDVRNENQIIVNIAHYNKVTIEDNIFGNSMSNFMRIAGIDKLLIRNNTFSNTSLVLTDEVKIGGHLFSGKFNSVRIANNVFDNKSKIRISNASSIGNIEFLDNIDDIGKATVRFKNKVDISNSKILNIIN